jgi:hypothetical protein
MGFSPSAAVLAVGGGGLLQPGDIVAKRFDPEVEGVE